MSIKTHVIFRGGSKDGEIDISETGFCGVNYEGIACASCSAKSAKFGCTKVIDIALINFVAGQRCFDCETNALYYLRFTIYLAIQIGVIIITTKYMTAFIKNTYLISYRAYLAVAESTNNSDRRRNIQKAALIKIVIDFVQLLNIISQFNFEWPVSVIILTTFMLIL